MILRLLSLLLFATTPLIAVSNYDVSSNHCHSKHGKCDPTVCIDRVPYVISKPGVYKLCKDVVYTQTNAAAITISSNNVTLDLGQHTIDLNYQGFVGIQIGNGSSVIEDVTVKNGTIKNTILTQAVATSNDFFYPLVATTTTYPNGLPVGVNSTYPSPTFNFTVGGIIGTSLYGAVFENLEMNQVLYGIVVTTPPADTTDTLGYITIDRVNIFDFGVSYPSAVTVTPVAYGSGIVLAGTPVNPMINLRVTNSNLNSQSSKFATQVFSAEGLVWENNFTSANAGPVPSTTNPPPAGSPLLYPLIQGPISFVNSSHGVVQNCEAHNSNTLFEAQYCTGFDFINCRGWGTFHNGIGILFDTDVIVKGCSIHRAEGPYVAGGAVQAGSGIKINVSDYVYLEDSVFTGFDILGTNTDSNGAGIATAASNYSTIIYNNVSGNNYGIKEVHSTSLAGIPFTSVTTATSPYYLTNSYYTNNSTSNFVANYFFANNTTVGANSPTNPWSTAVVVSTTLNPAPVAPYANLEP